MNPSIVSHKQRLDAVFATVNNLDDVDTETLSHWTKYLCVLVSGYIERSIQTIILDFVKNQASPDVTHFVARGLQSFTNAKMNKIFNLAEQFSAEKRKSLEAATDEELKDAVDSIVANRHQIAHGANIGLSFVTVRNYYERVVRVIDEVQSCFSNST